MDSQRDIFAPSEGDSLSQYTLTGRDQLTLVLASIAAIALACGFPTKTEEVSADISSQISTVLGAESAE